MIDRIMLFQTTVTLRVELFSIFDDSSSINTVVHYGRVIYFSEDIS